MINQQRARFKGLKIEEMEWKMPNVKHVRPEEGY